MRTKDVNLATYLQPPSLEDKEASLEAFCEALDTDLATLLREELSEFDRVSDETRDTVEDLCRVIEAGKISQQDVLALEGRLPETHPLKSFTRTPTATNYQVGVEGLSELAIGVMAAVGLIIANIIAKVLAWFRERHNVDTGPDIHTQRKVYTAYSTAYKEHEKAKNRRPENDPDVKDAFDRVKENKQRFYESWNALNETLLLGKEREIKALFRPEVLVRINTHYVKRLKNVIETLNEVSSLFEKADAQQTYPREQIEKRLTEAAKLNLVPSTEKGVSEIDTFHAALDEQNAHITHLSKEPATQPLWDIIVDPEKKPLPLNDRLGVKDRDWEDMSKTMKELERLKKDFEQAKFSNVPAWLSEEEQRSLHQHIQFLQSETVHSVSAVVKYFALITSLGGKLGQITSMVMMSRNSLTDALTRAQQS